MSRKDPYFSYKKLLYLVLAFALVYRRSRIAHMFCPRKRLFEIR